MAGLFDMDYGTVRKGTERLSGLEAPRATPSLWDYINAVSMTPVPIVSDVAAGLLAAKDVREGNYGSGALNLAGLIPFVPALGGIFKGVKGATKAEKQALLKAQKMAREGANRDEIWNATLWYKGKDGKWRTEMSVEPLRLEDLQAQVDAMRAANKAKGLPIETGTGDLRGEIARRNAVGLLGLSETNTAADRARAMGFDAEEYFHGSPTGEVVPDILGIQYLTPSSAAASEYASEVGIKHATPTVFPLRNSGYKPARNIDPMGDPVKIEKLESSGIDQDVLDSIDMYQGMDYSLLRDPEFVAKLKKTTPRVSYSDPGVMTPHETIAVLDPEYSKLRSRFAAFDPARRDEADLLAGLLPYAIPAGLLGMFLTRPGEGYE